MGDPGYYKTGSGGSIGGQGGGKGGDGANSLCAFPNAPFVAGLGGIGYPGADGGPAGKGGRGGGAIVIKANEIEINATHKIFHSNGENGFPGSNGGDGGEGGMFGEGQGGCCDLTGTKATLQGGNGGYGDAGDGGAGGDGGDGGKPGYIWIASHTTITSKGPVAAVFSVKGGSGGAAGQGGWGSWVRWNRNINAKNECTGMFCRGTGGCDSKYCDVLTAMQILASAKRTHKDNNCNGTLVWANDNNQKIAEFNTATGLLITYTYYAGCPKPTEHIANLSNCANLMKVLAGCMNNNCGQIGSSGYNRYKRPLGTVVSSSYPIEIQYYLNIGSNSLLSPMPFIRFVWDAPNTRPYIEYMNCGNERCYFAMCPPISQLSNNIYDPEFPPKQAAPGSDGDDAPDGTIGNNPDDNVVVEDGAGWIMQPTGVATESNKAIAMVVYPNPSKDVLYVQIINAPQLMHIKADIYDVAGKLVIKNAVIVQQTEGTYKIDIQQLPKGYYMLKIEAGSTTLNKTFTKN